MSFKCPACGVGFMCEKDVGYDECSECDFDVIYDDGREPAVWSPDEYAAILASGLEEFRKHREKSE